MNKEKFISELQKEALKFNNIVATEKGDWIVKGFIDIYRRIYTITLDTKVVSKVIELLLIPAFENFAIANNFALELPPQQNFYPDITLISKETGDKYAVDIKSTYIDGTNRIKGMTLGAFTGYFRNRASLKNTKYPYGSYSAHLVMGVIYTQIKENINEKVIYDLSDLDRIESVIKDFQFFVQPKYKIASARPGSGNTKNIGSTTDITKLLNGEGVFSLLGEEVYDDYWMYYLTPDMARALEVPRPYHDLKTYMDYKQKGIDIIAEHKDVIEKIAEEEDTDLENGNENAE